MEDLPADAVNDGISLGIKKIVDCRIGKDGKAMYQVKWNMTWEPAENLTGCQHLVDRFWEWINRFKSSGVNSSKCRNGVPVVADKCLAGQVLIDAPQGCQNFMISDSLVTSTNSTFTTSTLATHLQGNAEAGDQQRKSRLLYLESSGNHNISHGSKWQPVEPARDTGLSFFQKAQATETLPKGTKRRRVSQDDLVNDSFVDSTTRQATAKTNVKQDPGPQQLEDDDLMLLDDSDEPDCKAKLYGPGSNALHILDRFQSEYVRIILVCTVCGKEQHQRSVSKWKRHWLTHSIEKPHICSWCGKGFVQLCKLKTHMATHPAPKPVKFE